METKSIKECIETVELALWSCAHSCANTLKIDDALKMSEAIDKLSISLERLYGLEIFIEEREEK